MKFGKRLLDQLHPEWADNYLPYKGLKHIINELLTQPTEARFKLEGDFLATLLAAIEAVNGFYAGKESEYARRLESLAKTLASPKTWLLQSPGLASDEEEPDFPEVVARLEGGVHVPVEQHEALHAFLSLCSEVDLLRKFSVLNSLAVTKISKKHDKHSTINLSAPILALVQTQAFYTSRQLAATFTHAQCIASEILTAATQMTPPSVDYTCSICLELLNMPVVLSCTHRFCYGCLKEAALFNHQCPLCKKETDLDPANYEIDPVLNRFVASHFSRSGKSSPRHLPLTPPLCSHAPSSSKALDAKVVEDELAPLCTPPRPDSCPTPVQPPAPSQTRDKALLKAATPVANLALREEGTARAVAPVTMPSPPLAMSFPMAGASACLAPGSTTPQPGQLPGQLPLGRLLDGASMPMLSRAYAPSAYVASRPGASFSEAERANMLLHTMSGGGMGAAKPLAPAVAGGAGGGPPAFGAPRKRACVECHLAKSACEGDPCTRCKRLGKTCVTEPRKKRRRPGSDDAAAPTAATLTAAAHAVAPTAAPIEPPPAAVTTPHPNIPAATLMSSVGLSGGLPGLSPTGAAQGTFSIGMTPAFGFAQQAQMPYLTSQQLAAFRSNAQSVAFQSLAAKPGNFHEPTAAMTPPGFALPAAATPPAATKLPSLVSSPSKGVEAVDGFLDFTALELSSFLTEIDTELNK